MIVCFRCGHENEDGRNLCSQCRAYLGLSSTAAGSPKAAIALDDAAPVAEAAVDGPPQPQRPPRTAEPDHTDVRSAVAAQASNPSATPVPGADAARPLASGGKPRLQSQGGRVAPRQVRAVPTPAPRPVVPTPSTTTAPIPTVIAEIPARLSPVQPPLKPGSAPRDRDRFGAVRPDDTKYPRQAPSRPTAGAGRSSARPADGHGLLTMDDDLSETRLCPRCGLTLPLSRRFCRCGATLDPPRSTQPDDDTESHLSWYRRVMDGAGGRAAFWSAMRAANNGAKPPFDKPRAPRQRFAQASAVLAAVVVGASQLGSWGEDLRSTAFEEMRQTLPLSLTVVDFANATTVPEGPADPGFEPQLAIDRDLGTAWSRPWTPLPKRDEAACESATGTDKLVLTLAAPTRVDRLRIAAGLPKAAFARNTQDRPHTLAITSSDGSCVEAQLEETAALQTVNLKGVETTSITIAIVDVFPGDAIPPAKGRVALSEVVAERR